jgi:hypothetical protein
MNSQIPLRSAPKPQVLVVLLSGILDASRPLWRRQPVLLKVVAAGKWLAQRATMTLQPKFEQLVNLLVRPLTQAQQPDQRVCNAGGCKQGLIPLCPYAY